MRAASHSPQFAWLFSNLFTTWKNKTTLTNHNCKTRLQFPPGSRDGDYLATPERYIGGKRMCHEAIWYFFGLAREIRRQSTASPAGFSLYC
jgi:hypothetical protein